MLHLLVGLGVSFLAPDPDARVGRIIVRGNVVTADRVIRNALAVHTGQPVPSRAGLFLAAARLGQLPWWDARPTVEVERTPFASALRDVVVTVTERRR